MSLEHIGGTTPRNFGPCGVTLDRNAPQLFAHPGRRFQYFDGLDSPIVEALVIPVDLGGAILGTIWVVSHDDEVKFDSEDVRIMTGLAEFTSCALRMTRVSEMRQTQANMEVDNAARAAQLEQLSAKLINLQDEERRRLARELHDLRSAISWYVEGFAEGSGIRVELEIPENLGRLPSEIETALFRVVQQSLANIHRHSGSPVAVICIAVDDHAVNLEIRDEGHGFPPEVLTGFLSGTHLVGVGMAGMRERIRDMGGFEVRSSEQGASIHVSLMLSAKAQAAKA